MAQKSHGSRHGTRHKFARDSDTTLTVNDRLQKFNEGEKVLISLHPSVQEGRVHSRFHGKAATVDGFRGDSVKLEVKDGQKQKYLFLKPVHLKKLEEE